MAAARYAYDDDYLMDDEMDEGNDSMEADSVADEKPIDPRWNELKKLKLS